MKSSLENNILHAWLLPLVTTFTVLGVLFYVYRETALSIVNVWNSSETYAHGYLIVPMSLIMIWHRRRVLAKLSPKPTYWILIVQVFVALGWLFGQQGGIQVVAQFGLVAMAPVIVWAILGTQVASSIAFPLGFLFFAVPVGEVLIEPLMDYTAIVTVAALQWTGIPVFVEGRYITIPSGNWEVAYACSGVRYLIASVALGCLYAYITYRSYWRRALFIGLAIIIPIVANWVRAYGIVMIGHLSDNKLATGVDHIIYGWVFFGLVMLLLFWVGSFWHEEATAQSDKSMPEFPREGLVMKGGYLSFLFISLLVLFSLGSGKIVDQWINYRSDSTTYAAGVVLPPAEKSWSGPHLSNETWEPQFSGATSMRQAIYTNRTGVNVHVYTIYYAREEQGRELITQQNHLFGSRWKQLDYSKRGISPAQGGQRTVDERILRLDDVQRVTWSWYDIAGQQTGLEYMGKALGVLSRLTINDQGSALIAISADYTENPDEARMTLVNFLDKLPALNAPLIRLSGHHDGG